jgi:hypothetical protein
MTDGYPMVVVRADGDDVAAWFARHGVPAEVVAGPEGWVSVDGLTQEDLEQLGDLVRDLRTSAIVLSADADELVVDVVGTDPALESAPDDAHALATASGRPDLATKVAEVLANTGLGVGARHRRLTELLGLPSARAARVAAPARRSDPDPRAVAPVGGAVVIPSWMSAIVLWTGVATIAIALLVALLADTRRGLVVAGLCALAGLACVVLGVVGRLTRR